MTGHQAQFPTLPERGQQQYAFHPREVLADAHPRAASEREIGELGPARALLRSPTIRVEAFRIGKPAWIAMDHIRTHQNDVAGFDFIASCFERLRSHPADPPRG